MAFKKSQLKSILFIEPNFLFYQHMTSSITPYPQTLNSSEDTKKGWTLEGETKQELLFWKPTHAVGAREKVQKSAGLPLSTKLIWSTHSLASWGLLAVNWRGRMAIILWLLSHLRVHLYFLIFNLRGKDHISFQLSNKEEKQHGENFPL